jgi:hypothetical protein
VIDENEMPLGRLTMHEAYIVAAARTAGGRRGGMLRDWHPADLAGQVLDALVERSGADPALIEDVIMGCVSQFGQQSGNVARNAVMSSRLPESVPGTSVDRQCGSSQQAIHFAAATVMSGQMDVVIAAGVESMTRVPMGMTVALPAKAGMGMPYGEGMAARFFHKLGASLLARTICASAGAEALVATYGGKVGMHVEFFAESKLILVWGSNPITSSVHFWNFAQQAKRAGANAVVVSGALLARVEALKGSLIPAGVDVAVTRNYGASANETFCHCWHLQR